MMRIKQKHIDNGQIGGSIQIIMQSMFIFNLITFVNTIVLVYSTVLYKYISIKYGIAIILFGAISWWIVYYMYIYPSIITFANRQAYAHKSPIKADLERIDSKLDEMVQYEK